MIRTKSYTTIMSETLEDDLSGDFALRHKIIQKGARLKTYDPIVGMIYTDTFDDDFPIVTLEQGGLVWMPDTPFEQEGVKPAIPLARGDVLISGLGIGLLPMLIRNKPEVKSIDIVEVNGDVIKMIYDQIWHHKMNMIQGDLWKYLKTTEKRYDFIHIDIWGNIIAPIIEIDKAVEMATPLLKEEGDIRCWLQELYQRIKSRIPKGPSRTLGVIFGEPCLICGKTLRHDFAGLCMDCADCMGLSEIFLRKGAKLG